jgi:hypothetical protein
VSKTERVKVGYKISARLAEDVRNQARRERRWPAHVVTDALRMYLAHVRRGKLSERN